MNRTAADSAPRAPRSAATHYRLGPFVTRVATLSADGRRLVATSRLHRKGLAPHQPGPLGVESIPATRRDAWRQVWAPERLAWWTAVSFIVGSACFAVGGWGVSWPAETFAPLRETATANRIFFVGSLLFSGAAYLQLLEVANGDVVEAVDSRTAGWRWLGWKPRNLGWLASAVQLAGTLCFNADTANALRSGLGWEEQDLLVWTPSAIGCACFLVSSALAWLELSQGAWSFAPRSASWWSVAMNAIGSVAFAASAVDSFVRPGPPDADEFWRAGLYTFVGALCFLVGSYLLIPELFDGEARAQSDAAPPTTRG